MTTQQDHERILFNSEWSNAAIQSNLLTLAHIDEMFKSFGSGHESINSLLSINQKEKIISLKLDIAESLLKNDEVFEKTTGHTKTEFRSALNSLNKELANVSKLHKDLSEIHNKDASFKKDLFLIAQKLLQEIGNTARLSITKNSELSDIIGEIQKFVNITISNMNLLKTKNTANEQQIKGLEETIKKIEEDLKKAKSNNNNNNVTPVILPSPIITPPQAVPTPLPFNPSVPPLPVPGDRTITVAPGATTTTTTAGGDDDDDDDDDHNDTNKNNNSSNNNDDNTANNNNNNNNNSSSNNDNNDSPKNVPQTNLSDIQIENYLNDKNLSTEWKGRKYWYWPADVLTNAPLDEFLLGSHENRLLFAKNMTQLQMELLYNNRKRFFIHYSDRFEYILNSMLGYKAFTQYHEMEVNGFANDQYYLNSDSLVEEWTKSILSATSATGIYHFLTHTPKGGTKVSVFQRIPTDYNLLFSKHTGDDNNNYSYYIALLSQNSAERLAFIDNTDLKNLYIQNHKDGKSFMNVLDSVKDTFTQIEGVWKSILAKIKEITDTSSQGKSVDRKSLFNLDKLPMAKVYPMKKKAGAKILAEDIRRPGQLLTKEYIFRFLLAQVITIDAALQCLFVNIYFGDYDGWGLTENDMNIFIKKLKTNYIEKFNNVEGLWKDGEAILFDTLTKSPEWPKSGNSSVVSVKTVFESMKTPVNEYMKSTGDTIFTLLSTWYEKDFWNFSS